MKTLVVYYSYTGNTRKLAAEIAERENADLYEVKDIVPLSTAKAFAVGAPRSARGKAMDIEPIAADFSAYEKVIVMGPIWAGKPAPQIMAALDMLEPGQSVEAIMLSKSGKSNGRESVLTKTGAMGCKLLDYQDVKS